MPIYKQHTQSFEALYMGQRSLERAFDSLCLSRRIACNAADEEKPYHQLEKCAQNSVDQPVVSCGLLSGEYCSVGDEESKVGFEEPCQLPELVNCWGSMGGVLEVCDHRLLHMESF